MPSSLKRGVRPQSRLWSLMLASGLMLAGSVSIAATLKGRIVGQLNLVNPVLAEARDPAAHGYNFREPVTTVSAALRRPWPYVQKEIAVALIAQVAQPKAPKREIWISGGRTTPVTLVATPGTQLVFKNADPFPHRLYGVGNATFNPADTGKGASRTWAVPGPGVYEIRDELAPSLRMWVVSEPKAVQTTFPDAKGAFLFEAAPPGTYVLKAYFAGKPVGQEVPVLLKGPNSAIDTSNTPIRVAPPKSAKKK